MKPLDSARRAALRVQNVDPTLSLLFATKDSGYVGHSTLQRGLAIELFEDPLLGFALTYRSGREVGAGRYKDSEIMPSRASAGFRPEGAERTGAVGGRMEPCARRLRRQVTID